jgi:WD40 repeat protein
VATTTGHTHPCNQNPEIERAKKSQVFAKGLFLLVTMQEGGETVGSEYVLSAELVGHDRDVRGCCALSNGEVVTTSRDNTVRVWKRDSAEGKLFFPGGFRRFFVLTLVRRQGGSAV